MRSVRCWLLGHRYSMVAATYARGGRGVALYRRCMGCGDTDRIVCWPWVRTDGPHR